MKALYFEKHGELDVIQYGEVPEPETGPGQIKMRVHATALNYLDIWVPVGSFYTVVAEYKIDSTIIKAVDGDKVSVYLDESNCSNACWRARDGKADCRLKD